MICYAFVQAKYFHAFAQMNNIGVTIIHWAKAEMFVQVMCGSTPSARSISYFAWKA